jgi:hypothetical protein
MTTRNVTTVVGSTKVLTPTSALPIEVAIGDLITFGVTAIQDAKITKISPHDEFSATITCVPLAPAILQADVGTIPEYVPVLDQPTAFYRQEQSSV